MVQHRRMHTLTRVRPNPLLPGSIHKDSAAAQFLLERGVSRKDFNSYGSRRGNDEVMTRGTFANIRLVNKMLGGEVGPYAKHVPSGEKMRVFDAAMVRGREGTGTGGEGGWEGKKGWYGEGGQSMGGMTATCQDMPQKCPYMNLKRPPFPWIISLPNVPLNLPSMPPERRCVRLHAPEMSLCSPEKSRLMRCFSDYEFQTVGFSFFLHYFVLESLLLVLPCSLSPPQRYKQEGHQTVVIAGAEYGSGSSRDWAAKGPYLQVGQEGGR